MSESVFGRFWNSLRLPGPGGMPPPQSPKVLALRKRQRRLVVITLGAVVLIGAGIGIFEYIQTAPQRADKEYQEGMKLMRPGKYSEAVVHFTRALSVSPQLSDAYLQRGNAHQFAGETDAALADFQAAADLNGNLAEAHIGIAMIYIGRHDQRHALEELNKSIAIHPTIEAYYERGEILESQGQHQKAIDDFDLAIAQARDAPDVYLARARARANLGDLEGAHADRVLANRLQR